MWRGRDEDEDEAEDEMSLKRVARGDEHAIAGSSAGREENAADGHQTRLKGAETRLAADADGTSMMSMRDDGDTCDGEGRYDGDQVMEMEMMMETHLQVWARVCVERKCV